MLVNVLGDLLAKYKTLSHILNYDGCVENIVRLILDFVKLCVI